jgi:hypothetical protein
MIVMSYAFLDEPHPADPGYEPESATLPEAG